MHSAKIEERYADAIPGIGLGKTISEASGNVTMLGIRMNSNRRLEAFYAGGALLLAVIFFFLLWAQPNEANRPTTTSQLPSATIPTSAKSP